MGTMAKALTARTVETIKPPGARREVPDGLLRGLYLVVQPSGVKSWAVRYRHHGKPRKHTIGNYPAIDLASARDLGAKALRAVAEGRDPGREKVLARQAGDDGFGNVAALFLERHAKRNTRERTWRETERILNTEVVPRWRGRTIHQITRRDVLDLLDGIVDR